MVFKKLGIMILKFIKFYYICGLHKILHYEFSNSKGGLKSNKYR